jgi:hypothetical protein
MDNLTLVSLSITQLTQRDSCKSWLACNQRSTNTHLLREPTTIYREHHAWFVYHVPIRGKLNRSADPLKWVGLLINLCQSIAYFIWSGLFIPPQTVTYTGVLIGYPLGPDEIRNRLLRHLKSINTTCILAPKLALCLWRQQSSECLQCSNPACIG